jgi:hypothetical protein
MTNDPIAETRERVPQTLSEEAQEKLKEIFSWLHPSPVWKFIMCP